MKRALFVLTVVLALLIVACSTAATPTAAPPTSAPVVTPTPVAPVVTATPGVSTLEAAKTEGKVTIYTTTDLQEFEPLVKEFSKQYPDIKVDYWRAINEEMTQRALNEFRSSNFTVDVVEGPDVGIVQMLNAGMLGQYKSPELSAFPDSSYDPDGYFVTARATLIVIGYNTNLVTKELAPATWDDLLDPKWAGQMAIESSDYKLIAYSTLVWGESRAQNFWKRLAAQKPRVVSGHTELANMLAAGEFAVTPTVYAHRIQSLKDDKKAPVDWVRTNPVFESPVLVATAKNAPHPNAARVWVDWYLGPAGQQALVNLGRIPVRLGIKTKPEGLLNGLNIYFADPRAVLKTDVQTQYRTLFGIK